jgi:protein O-mannosyl-transferase
MTRRVEAASLRAAAALVLLTVVVYIPALRAGYVWDDGVLTENPLVEAPDGLVRFWLSPAQNPHETHYWPLVYSTFWLEYRLWGREPWGYHLDNVLLHAACVLLLWAVLRRLEVPGAWPAAALFAVHPVHVESVAWIAERKDVLSGALYLGALRAYLESRGSSGRSGGWYALAFGLFVLALLSKSIVVTFPLVVLLVLWWKQGELVWRRDVRPLVPFVLAGGLLTLFDLWLFYGISTASTLEISAIERLQVAGRALWFYPAKLLWPHPLAALYPKWTLDATSVWTWLPHVAALGLLAALWQLRPRIGRGPFAAVAFYVVTIAPALNLLKHGFMVFAWVADRFQYLASAGLIVLVAAAATRLGSSAGRQRMALAWGALLLVLGGLTWRQAGFYHDYVTLFRHNTAVYPESWPAHVQLSTALTQEGRFDEGIAALNDAIRLRPAKLHTYVMGRALLQAQAGRASEAAQSFEDALGLEPEDAEVHSAFAGFLAGQGENDRAAEHYRRALRSSPDDPATLNDLGCLLWKQGAREEGLRHLRRAVDLRPGEPAFRANLEEALRDAGEARAVDEGLVPTR